MRRMFPTIGLCLLLVADDGLHEREVADVDLSRRDARFSGAPPRSPRSEPAPSAAPAAPAAAAAAPSRSRRSTSGFTPMDLTVDAPGRYDGQAHQYGHGHPRRHVPGRRHDRRGRRRRDRLRSRWTSRPTASRSSARSPDTRPAGMKGTITVKGRPPRGRRRPRRAGARRATWPPTRTRRRPVTYDATAPERLPEGEVHDIDLVITESQMTVAPGFVQAVWTFGGTVPGPVIRVTVGDTIRVHLKNPAENQLPHSIDFHASQVAWNDEMTLDRSRRGEGLRVDRRLRRRLDVPLRDGAGPPPHRERHVRHGHRRAEGRPAQGRQGVRPRPERVVPRTRRARSPAWRRRPSAPRPRTTSSSTASPTSTGRAAQGRRPGSGSGSSSSTPGPNIDSSFHIVGTIFDTVTKEGIAPGQGQRGLVGLAGGRPLAGPGRDRRVHDGRGRPVPDRDPRLQPRRTRRPRPRPGRRRRPVGLMALHTARSLPMAAPTSDERLL